MKKSTRTDCIRSDETAPSIQSRVMPRTNPNPPKRSPNADPPTHRSADTFPAPHAYLALANSLETQVQANVFRPGDRLPSVRSLCGDHRLSMETVLHTLRVLEDRGLIEARPRSGFYIKFRNQLPEPLPQPLRLESSPVEVSKLRYQAFSVGNSKDVIPLSTAVPSPEILPTAKLGRMISAITRSATAEIVGYAEPSGHQKLRKQLARRSSDWGCLMKPEDFIVTNGAAEAISLALRTVCAPNSAVLVESPTYYGILEMIENLGLRVIELPTDPRTGVSPDDIEHAIHSIPKIGACLLVTNYSNPLGCSISVEKKKRLVSILAKYQVPLIEDDHLRRPLSSGRSPTGDRKGFRHRRTRPSVQFNIENASAWIESRLDCARPFSRSDPATQNQPNTGLSDDNSIGDCGILGAWLLRRASSENSGIFRQPAPTLQQRRFPIFSILAPDFPTARRICFMDRA